MMSPEFEVAEGLLNEKDQAWRRRVRTWAEAEAAPLVEDAFERGEFPRALAEKVGEQKWFGVALPEECGCAGLSYRAYGILCQEMERADSGLRSLVSVQSSLAMHAIFKYGSEEQRGLLPGMACGRTLGCFALTEPGAGSDPASMTLSARKTSAGWLLKGSKRWVTSGTLADVAVVWARTPEGIRGFLVRDAQALASPIDRKLSLRMSASAEMAFDDLEVPADALLPGSDCGIKAPLACLTQARFGICWGAVGAAAHCYEIALAHCRGREQFGRPLAGFQLVQEKLADVYADIVRGQLLNVRLAALMDEGGAHPALISLGKREACRTARRAARKCRDLLGASGVLLSSHVMRHMNNMEAVFTYEGTDHVHTLAIGKYLTGTAAFS